MVEDKPYSYAKDELQDVYVMGKKCHCGHLEEMIEEIKELKEDNKKLARQIEDRVNRMRKSGM